MARHAVLTRWWRSRSRSDKKCRTVSNSSKMAKTRSAAEVMMVRLVGILCLRDLGSEGQNRRVSWLVLLREEIKRLSVIGKDRERNLGIDVSSRSSSYDGERAVVQDFVVCKDARDVNRSATLRRKLVASKGASEGASHMWPSKKPPSNL